MYEPNLYRRAINIFKQKMPKETARNTLGNLKLQKLGEYLYFLEFYDWNYSEGVAFLKGNKDGFSDGMACSSVRNGNFYGRNFDYYYTEFCEFILHTAATKGRHASIGVAHMPKIFTKAFVDSYKWTDAYDILPFCTMDGINDAGVTCNINLVPAGDKGRTTGTNAEASQSLPTFMLVRFILDYADSAKDAVEKLAEVNWFLHDTNEVHVMIADADETYIVEFVENELMIFSDADDDYEDIPNDPIMTNFYLADWDGTIITGFDTEGGISPEDTTLTAHAEGCERYEILEDGYSSANTAEGMALLMHSVWYSNAYSEETDPFWYSDLTGETPAGDYTIYQNAEDYAEIKAAAIEAWEHKQRNGIVWHTTHCSVYDIPNRTLTVWTQEDTTSQSFKLKADVPFNN